MLKKLMIWNNLKWDGNHNYRGTNRMKSEHIRMILVQNPDPKPLPSLNRDPNLNHFHPI